MIGQTISHYRITHQLGAGGMGVVYKAVDTKLDRSVALKFLPPEFTRDPDAKARFVHEAKAASALDHPNVCTIHEIGEMDDGKLFIVMACYEGEILKDRIERGPLSINEAADITRQTAEGLAKAHEREIVHRDIKPANIFLTNDGLVKILDFGVAKLSNLSNVTKPGTTLGTVSYMSPEQARGEVTDNRTDLWGLGVVLYEMVTGRLPFQGDQEQAVIYSILNLDPDPVTGLRTGVPLELERIIGKCLAKDSAERYQHADDLLADLLHFRRESSQVSTRSMATGRPAVSRARRWPWMLGFLALGAAMALAAWIVWPEGEPTSSPEKMALAIMEFRDLTAAADPIASITLTELLNTAMVEACPVRVQSPEYLRDIRRRLFGSSGISMEEGQDLEIARKGEATYVLTGRIGVLDDERFVTWRLIDVESGESIGADRVESGKMTMMVDDIVAAVLPKIAMASGAEQPVEQVPVERITTASSSAYDHYILGLWKIRNATREEALREFELAVSQDSSFALAHLEVARLYFGGNAVHQDIALARQSAAIAERHEDRLGVKDRLHLKAFQHGLDYEATLQMATFREILDRWPDDRETIVELQNQAVWWWDFREYVETARKGMKLYTDDPEIGYSYSYSLLVLGHYEESLQVARSYLEKFPESTFGWLSLGRSFFYMGYPDSAEIAWKKFVEIYPYWSRGKPGFFAYFAGDIEKAISIEEDNLSLEDLSNVRRLPYMYGYTHTFGLPALYYQGGRFSDAVRIMEEAGQYVGEDPSFWQLQMGSLLTSVGLVDRALELAHEMEQSDEIRMRVFAVRFKGHAQVASGDLAGARATAVRSHELAGTIGLMMSYHGYKIEADIALAENDPSSALEALDSMKNITIFVNGMLPIEHLTMLARAHQMAGDLEEAVTVHNETLRLFGGNALSHYELGKLHEESGRPDEAIQHYRRFLEMWRNADEGLPQPEYARARLESLGAGSP